MTKVEPMTPPPCSELYDLVFDSNWPKVIDHCRTNPYDAEFQDGDTGETPLYLACQWSPPLEVLEALMDANPLALQRTTYREHRDLPIHMMCRFQSTPPEALQACVQRYPEGAGHATKYGKTALQVLWAHARPTCMEEGRLPTMITINDDDNGEDESRQVDLFWHKMEVLVEAVARCRQQLTTTPITNNSQEHGNESSSSLPPPPVYYHVHAVVSLGALGCPFGVLEHFCHRYPQELSQRDDAGQLPLHVAVGPTQWSPTNKRKYKPREQAIIQFLLQKYPDAARSKLVTIRGDECDTIARHCRHLPGNESPKIDESQGRFPLHIALAHRHTWEGGVQALFQAAPDLLRVRDPVTQLYPFQLAAVPARDNAIVDLTTVWTLLKQQPELLTMTPLPGSTSKELCCSHLS